MILLLRIEFGRQKQKKGLSPYYPMIKEQITCQHCSITSWSESKDFSIGSEDFGSTEYLIRRWRCDNCKLLSFHFQILKRVSAEPKDLVVSNFEVVKNIRIHPS